MTTIKDVARAAGVSVATVSYVFNNVPKVSESTRRRVMQVAGEIGYTIPRAPFQTAHQRVRNLLAIFPYVVVEEASSGQEQNYFVTEVIWGFENTVKHMGYGLLIAGWGQGEDLPQRLADSKVEGILLTGGLYPHEFIARVKETGIPAILVGATAPDNLIDSVSADNVDGACQAVRHLIALGHRRIGFINGPATSGTSEEKARGVQLAFQTGGLSFDPSLVRVGDFSIKSGFAAASELLRQPNPPSALFVGDDAMAVGALKAIQGSNMRVPEDVAVIGYGDGPMSRVTTPPLTTVKVKKDRLGELAARSLIDRINGIIDETITVKLTSKLIVRGSCGAPIPSRL